MTTLHPRVNVTLTDDVMEVLEGLAKRTKRSISAIAREYIIQGIDTDEDIYFSKLGDARLMEPGKRISHEEFWNKALPH